MVNSLIGRDVELRAVHDFLAAVDASRALVIAGEPGIGKTTVWQAGLDEVRSKSLRVLVANPAEGEAKLSYVALGDLLGDAFDLAASDLPGVQRRALEAALLRAETKGPLQQRTVAAAFLGALTSLARERSVIVAIDDVQWLDRVGAGSCLRSPPPERGTCRFPARDTDGRRRGRNGAPQPAGQPA
jgi:Cdc6-like AAA superfamily ATPase